MRQLTYIKKNRLRWWDVEEPELESPMDAIVRPLAAARCDGDKVFLFNDITTPMRVGLALHYLDPVTTDLLGRNPYKGPIPVGHECVAEIVSCGDEVAFFKRGDKVVVPWAISCGACLHCASSLTSKCLKAGETFLSAYGFGESMGTWGGMVSDFLRVPFADNMLVRVPKGVDPVSLASASDNIPDGWSPTKKRGVIKVWSAYFEEFYQTQKKPTIEQLRNLNIGFGDEQIRKYIKLLPVALKRFFIENGKLNLSIEGTEYFECLSYAGLDPMKKLEYDDVSLVKSM